MIWKTLPRSELIAGLSGYVAGVGPDLVLIHGVGLRAEAWNAIIPELAPHFRLHLVDMPGHGASLPVTEESITGFAAPIATLIDQIGGPVRIVGHSMGAMLALALADMRPDRVVGIGALNAIYRRTPQSAQAVRARAHAITQNGPGDPAPTLQRWFGTDPTGADAAAAVACRDWLTQCTPTGYARAYRVFACADGPDDAALTRLACPALFLTGADEPNSTPKMSRAMACLAPHGRAVALPRAAHMAPMTHPRDVARHIIETLTPTPSAPRQRANHDTA